MHSARTHAHTHTHSCTHTHGSAPGGTQTKRGNLVHEKKQLRTKETHAGREGRIGMEGGRGRVSSRILLYYDSKDLILNTVLP